MRIFILSLLISTSLLFGCGKKEKTIEPKPVIITITYPKQDVIETLQETIGSLESTIEPRLVAEVSGRIEKIYVHPGDDVSQGQLMAKIDPSDLLLAKQGQLADVKRLEALYKTQGRTAQRYRELREDKYVSQSQLEEATSQEIALKEQWMAAKAQLALIEHDILKSKILSPIQAKVESQLVSEGGYIRSGEALFQIVTMGTLRAHLPFPENAASLLKPGLKVRLSTPTAPDQSIEGSILDIKPMTNSARAIEAIVEIKNNGTWRPGSSVNAQVVVESHAQAIMVPEQSVILRPSGSVVYVIKNGKAFQRIVETGSHKAGQVEIRSGISLQDAIAVDGAGFLTDKASIKIQNGQDHEHSSTIN